MLNSVGSPRFLLVIGLAALVMTTAERAVLGQLGTIEATASGQSAAAMQLGCLGGVLLALLTAAGGQHVLRRVSLPRLSRARDVAAVLPRAIDPRGKDA